MTAGLGRVNASRTAVAARAPDCEQGAGGGGERAERGGTAGPAEERAAGRVARAGLAVPRATAASREPSQQDAERDRRDDRRDGRGHGIQNRGARAGDRRDDAEDRAGGDQDAARAAGGATAARRRRRDHEQRQADADQQGDLVARAEQRDRGLFRPRRREVDEQRADDEHRARGRGDDRGGELGGAEAERDGGDAGEGGRAASGARVMRAAYVRMPWSASDRAPRSGGGCERVVGAEAPRTRRMTPAAAMMTSPPSTGGNQSATSGREDAHVEVADARAAGDDDGEDPLQPTAHLVRRGDQQHRRAEDRAHLVGGARPRASRPPRSPGRPRSTRAKSAPTGPNHPVCIAATVTPNIATKPP